MHAVPVALALFFSLDRAALPEGTALLPHGDFVASLVFTPDGKTLISASGDGLVRLWDTGTRNARRRPSVREAFPQSARAEAGIAGSQCTQA